MTHTVVGLFNDRTEAQSAMEELVERGFIKENIDLSNRSFAEGTAGDDGYDSSTGTEGFGSSISNFFNSLFGDDETAARNYTNAASDAEAILTVQVDSDERARQAQEILDRNGAWDVDEHGSSAQGYAGSENTQRKTIPVVEEQLNVGKQQVERGGARIRSRIIERPVEESVRLREEHVVVNRRPVDRPVTDSDLQNFQPGEMELTERAEVPIIGKTSRVVEEVEVGKNVTEREETVRDTVRSTDVDVEQIDSDVSTNTKARPAKP